MEQELEKRGEFPGEKWRRKALLLPSSEIPPDFEPIRDQIESEFEDRSNAEFGAVFEGNSLNDLINRFALRHGNPWPRGDGYDHKFSPFKYDETGKYIP